MTNGVPLRLATHAMGTRFELALLEGPCDLGAAGEAAIEEIERWHRRLSRFAADSLVSHINREAAATPVSLDRDTFELLQDALSVWRASGGAFDITLCDSGAIRLDADRWTIAFDAPHVSIDLGGIGKGHALDCAARVLRRAGVTAALLHGGTSSIVAIGAPEGRDGWHVGVPSGGATRTIALRDVAVSVSDSFGSEQDRRGTAHIMDPRPHGAVPQPVRATVIGPSARLADAWSTALVVLGCVPDHLPRAFSAYVEVREGALL